MGFEKITFINADGLQLSGRLDIPEFELPHSYVIFAHCFTCNKNLSAVRNISRALTLKGFAVLRFDFTGLGESSGDFGNTTFSSNVEDLIHAAKFLETHYQAPCMLIGHSLGGAAVAFAAAQLDSVWAVVTIGAPGDPEHVSHLFTDSLGSIEEKGYAEVFIGGRPFTIKDTFVKDLQNRRMSEVVKSLRRPLLVLHSPQDTTVGIANAASIYKAAHHPKSFISLDGADHLLTQKKDSIYVGEVIATWASRYLTNHQKAPLIPEGQVSVRTGHESLTTDVQAGKHHLTVDEPASAGGNDFGPTPYDLLAGALGACTTLTLQLYAKRKGWDLQEATVHVNHKKDHAKDCDTCENSKARIDFFDKKLILKGHLDDSQKKRLLQIADKCPVHRTLHSEVKITTELKE